MIALPRAAAWACLLLLLGCSSPRRAAERDASAPVHAADSCTTRVERCNMRDDDCDGIIDEDADPSCGLAHAAAACVRGACVIERCTNGYYNCNGVNADGCEAKAPCDACQSACDAGSQPHDAGAMSSMSQQTGAPDAPAMSSSPDAAVSESAPSSSDQVAQAGTAGQAGLAAAGSGGAEGRSSRPVRAGSEPDADGGSTDEADQADAGSCTPERCDDRDNDCDGKVDEEGACSCAMGAPTGQGEQCDRCVCDACPEELDNCTGTDDDEWNMLCGDVLRCFGKNLQAGLCSATDSDCYQNGDGPCATEFRKAFSRGFMCTSNPVRVPCGGLTRMRLECYRTKCSAFCKS